MPTIGSNLTGADTELPPYGEEDEPRRRDVDRLFRSDDFRMPDQLRAEVHDVAERLFGTPAESPFKPGDRLGAYRIVRLLGAGGQAFVYEGVHEQLNRRVALKVPRADVAERLIREARLTAPLEHPHIVRVEDISSDPDAPYLVMECCTGGSLDAVLERYPGGLPLPDVRQIARATLEALEFAHRRGVVHRDVKPANILFDGRGAPKLGDLGIGMIPRADVELQHSVGVSRGTQAPMGTPMFVAPEQEDPSRLRNGTLDGRADLFSFGKTLFVMLTGASPRTIRPPSRLRPGLDPAWDDFVFKLVEESRDRRFSSATEALEALARIPEPSTAALPIVITPAEVAPPASRGRPAGGVFVGAGLASVGFAAYLEVAHTSLTLTAAGWEAMAPLKAGALLGAAFLLFFRRLDRRAAEATSLVAALLLSVLLAGWAPLLYALRDAHVVSRAALDFWSPIAAGTAVVFGLGCVVALFPRPPRAKRALPEVRVRPRRAGAGPRPGGFGRFLGIVARVIGAVAGLATALVSVILALLAAFIVLVASSIKGCNGGSVNLSTDEQLAGLGLVVLAAAGATFAVVMIAGLLRRLFSRADGDGEE